MEIIAALAFAGATFFALKAVQHLVQRKNKTRVEMASEIIREQEKLHKRLGLPDKVALQLARYGYRGSLTPALAVAAFAYLLGLVGLTAAGLDLPTALVSGIPLMILGTWFALAKLAARRQQAFNRQLLELFGLLAAQIEAGSGTARAFEQVVPNLEEPIRTEMREVLNAYSASGDLIAELKELSRKYPSKPFDSFIAALEIDRDVGAEIVPTLRQASEDLGEAFELAEEGKTEVASSRAEFFVMVGVIIWIGGMMFFGSDPSTRANLVSPFGISVMAVALLNFAFGLWRVLRMFRRVEEQL